MPISLISCTEASLPLPSESFPSRSSFSQPSPSLPLLHQHPQVPDTVLPPCWLFFTPLLRITTINNDPATLEVCIRASSALYLDVILSLPCRLCTRVHILSKMVLTLLHRMFVLAASLSGAVINSAFAFRFLSVWRSARWEHESEWEGIDTVWKVDPVKLIMGMLSVYFTIAAVLSYIGFFGIAKVRVPHFSPSSCPIELFFPIEKTIMGPIISRLYNS